MGREYMDEKYLENVVQAYSRLLWVVVSGYLPRSCGFSHLDVEECVADAFIAFASSPESYNPDIASLKSYLCGIARNKAIDAYRKRVNRNEVLFGTWEDAPELLTIAGRSLALSHSPTSPAYQGGDLQNPQDILLQTSEYDLLYDAIDRLEDPNREIVQRRFFLDQKPALISAEMNIGIKEVNNRLYRAKQQLSKLLSESESA